MVAVPFVDSEKTVEEIGDIVKHLGSSSSWLCEFPCFQLLNYFVVFELIWLILVYPSITPITKACSFICSFVLSFIVWLM